MAKLSERLLTFLLLTTVIGFVCARRVSCGTADTVARRDLLAISLPDGDNNTEFADLEKRAFREVTAICRKGAYVKNAIAAGEVDLVPEQNGEGKKPHDYLTTLKD
jgi:hypothetical protein